jgi:hypothetical protein
MYLMLATVKIRFMACPACGKAVRRGIRRFGPARAECARCHHQFDTGLRDWNGMSPVRKVLAILAEIFFPSFIRGFGQPEKVLAFFFYDFLIIIFPLVVVPALVVPTFAKNWPMSWFIILPILHAVWIVKMVKECTAYTRDQVPPKWKSFA